MIRIYIDVEELQPGLIGIGTGRDAANFAAGTPLEKKAATELNNQIVEILRSLVPGKILSDVESSTKDHGFNQSVMDSFKARYRK